MFKRFSFSNNNNTTIVRKRVLRKLYLSRMVITIGLISILGVLVVYTIFLSGVFKLHTIKFVPDTLNCASTEEIKSLFPRGKNMLFINTFELAAIVRAKFPCLAYVEIKKQYPDTFVVSISERELAVLLKISQIKPEILDLDTPEASDSSQSAQPKITKDDFLVEESQFSQYFGADKEGVLLIENPSNIPEIPTIYLETEKKLEVNTSLGPDLIQNSLAIFSQLKERVIPFFQAKISSDSLYIIGENKYIFSLKKDVTRQVISLQLILQKAKIDSVSVDKVDLRFDKPVVVYNKRK